jgi:hypothetical protein
MIAGTFAVHVGIKVQPCNEVDGGSFDPDTLPNAAAGPIEDVRGDQSLLADRNHSVATISGIVNKQEAIIC